jgi:hypothetical protein
MGLRAIVLREEDLHQVPCIRILGARVQEQHEREVDRHAWQTDGDETEKAGHGHAPVIQALTRATAVRPKQVTSPIAGT